MPKRPPGGVQARQQLVGGDRPPRSGHRSPPEGVALGFATMGEAAEARIRLRDAVRSGLVARKVADLVGPPKASRPKPVGKIFFNHYEPRVRDNEDRAHADLPLRGGPVP